MFWFWQYCFHFPNLMCPVLEVVILVLLKLVTLLWRISVTESTRYQGSDSRWVMSGLINSGLRINEDFPRLGAQVNIYTQTLASLLLTEQEYLHLQDLNLPSLEPVDQHWHPSIHKSIDRICPLVCIYSKLLILMFLFFKAFITWSKQKWELLVYPAYWRWYFDSLNCIQTIHENYCEICVLYYWFDLVILQHSTETLRIKYTQRW